MANMYGQVDWGLEHWDEKVGLYFLNGQYGVNEDV